MNVHLLYPPEPEDLELLATLLDDGVQLSAGEICSEHARTEILVAGRPTYDQLAELPDLRMLVVPWTGIPPATLAAVRKIPGLKLHNLHHNAAPVAELAVSLLLAAAKKVIPFDQQLRLGNWEGRYLPSQTLLLEGKRGLIVGYGEIGRRVKRILEGFGVEVRAIKRNVSAGEDPSIYPPEALPTLLPDSEILIIAVPHTDETDGLIGSAEMKLLPETAVLVNISRGEIIDQEALYLALSEGSILGAGLDVWYNYPGDKEARTSTLPGDHPFQELDNLVLSPHRAGHVQETEILRMKSLAELINTAVRGNDVPNPVNLDLGY
jgi:phosphoglycerate dehydrogenase-like enzyme